MIGKWRSELKLVIWGRKELDKKIGELEAQRDEINKHILRIMEKHQKNNIKLGGFETSIVRPQAMSLKEELILKWYKKHKISLPVRTVFDPALFEKDIKDNVVPAKMLEKFSKVETRTPYVRITAVKK